MCNSDYTRPEGSVEQERLDELLARHLPSLRGFLHRRAAHLVLARESAEDLAQSACRDVVEQLHDGRFELRTDAEFKQWLFEAGNLKLKTRYRFYGADKRNPGREIPLDASYGDKEGGAGRFHEQATSATPSRLLSLEENRASVRAAVASLGGRDAEVIRLVVFEGLPNQEAARQLSLEPAHFRVVLSRAMAKLSKSLVNDS